MRSTNIEFLPSPIQDENGKAIGIRVAIAFAHPQGWNRVRYRRLRFGISIIYDPSSITIRKVRLSNWAYVSTERQLGGSIAASLSPLGPSSSISIQNSQTTNNIK